MIEEQSHAKELSLKTIDTESNLMEIENEDYQPQYLNETSCFNEIGIEVDKSKLENNENMNFKDVKIVDINDKIYEEDCKNANNIRNVTLNTYNNYYTTNCVTNPISVIDKNTNKENIKVIIRVRPRLGKELDSKSSIKIENKSIMVTNCNKQFTFDDIIGEEKNQEEFFRSTAPEIAEAALNGYNGTIFVYGQTGAGKTHSLIGRNTNGKITENSGILPRSIDYLFWMIKNNPEYKTHLFNIKCSFLEIYNENLYDLIGASNTNSSENSNHGRGLFIRDQGDSVKVENLTEHPITSFEQALELVMIGLKNRVTASTAVNKESSRSHAVFSIYIENKMKVNNKKVTKRSVFHLIDLAGSERQKNTETIGERTKEAGKINKSLMNLGHVIKTLIDNSDGKKIHVHYRDSKLTHLLKDSLGGNSKTCIIANISPAYNHCQETISTLIFAQNAKQIKNKAMVNEEVTSEYFYKEELRKLLEQYEGMKQENKFLHSLITEKSEKPTTYNGFNQQLGNLNLSINLNPYTGFNKKNFGLDDLEKQLSLMEEENSIKEKKLAELIGENEFLNQRLEKLDVDYKLLKLEKKDEETKKEDALIELTKFKEALRLSNQVNISNQSEIDLLKMELNEKENKLLKEKILHNERLEESNKKVNQKENEIKKIKQDIYVLEAQIRLNEEKISQLVAELIQKDEKIFLLEKRIQEKDIEVLETKQKNFDLENNISTINQEFKAKETNLYQNLFEKTEKLNTLTFEIDKISREYNANNNELKKYKTIVKSHMNDINKIEKGKEIIEKKWKETDNELTSKTKIIDNLNTDISGLKSKVKVLEDTLDTVNKEHSMVIENKTNINKMNTIIQQKKEISELNKDIQNKQSIIYAYERLIKNLNLSGKSIKNISTTEIIQEIDAKTNELNNCKCLLHEFVSQVKNILTINNPDSSTISNEIAKSDIESASLEGKFKFYLEQFIKYNQNLEYKLTNVFNEKEYNVKKIEDLKHQIGKYYDLISNDLDTNISNVKTKFKQDLSDNNFNEYGIKIGSKQLLHINSSKKKSPEKENDENNPNLANLKIGSFEYSDSNKVESEILENLVSKNNGSKILQKVNDADLLKKKDLINAITNIGKKRPVLQNKFSLIDEVKEETENSNIFESATKLKNKSKDFTGSNYSKKSKISFS